MLVSDAPSQWLDVGNQLLIPTLSFVLCETVLYIWTSLLAQGRHGKQILSVLRDNSTFLMRLNSHCMSSSPRPAPLIWSTPDLNLICRLHSFTGSFKHRDIKSWWFILIPRVTKVNNKNTQDKRLNFSFHRILVVKRGVCEVRALLTNVLCVYLMSSLVPLSSLHCGNLGLASVFPCDKCQED